MARQFGGVELVYLVLFSREPLKQPQMDVLAMQLRIAFCHCPVVLHMLKPKQASRNLTQEIEILLVGNCQVALYQGGGKRNAFRTR